VNANDARLTRVYTAVTGSVVEDNAPNVPDPGEAHDLDFDLFVEAAAGAVIGNSGAPYTLTITCVNETKQTVVPAPFTSVSAQTFSAANNWTSSGDDFVTTQRTTFPLPKSPPNQVNDLYRFYVSLVNQNFQVVSFAESELFILV
jgi:hypothetical protein